MRILFLKDLPPHLPQVGDYFVLRLAQVKATRRTYLPLEKTKLTLPDFAAYLG
jgi:hypothetical protein